MTEGCGQCQRLVMWVVCTHTEVLVVLRQLNFSCQDDTYLLCLLIPIQVLFLKYYYSCKTLFSIGISSVWEFNCWYLLMRQTENHKAYLYILSILSQDWNSLRSWSFVFSEFLLKMSHGQVKVSVNKRNTSHFQ